MSWMNPSLVGTSCVTLNKTFKLSGLGFLISNIRILQSEGYTICFAQVHLLRRRQITKIRCLKYSFSKAVSSKGV